MVSLSFWPLHQLLLFLNLSTYVPPVSWLYHTLFIPSYSWCLLHFYAVPHNLALTYTVSSTVSECFTCSVLHSSSGTKARGFRSYIATFLHCCECLHCHSQTWTSLQMSLWTLHSILRCACQIFVLGHGLNLSCHFLSILYEVGEITHAFQSFLTLNIHKSVLQKVELQVYLINKEVSDFSLSSFIRITELLPYHKEIWICSDENSICLGFQNI